MRGSPVLDRSPPVPDGGGGGGGWAFLLTARGIIEAELVRGVLETSGIVPVALDATDPTPGAWLFLSGNVNALVRVFVPRSMLDAARLAMLETGVTAPEPAPPAPRPPGAVATAILVACVILAIVMIALATWHAAATCALRIFC